MSKVQIVRFWLLAIAAVAWAILYRDPTLGLVPIAFFSGQASCFCCVTLSCTHCAATPPAEIQIEIAGVVDDVCSECDLWNATFVVTYLSESSNICTWTLTLPSSICGQAVVTLEHFEIFGKFTAVSLGSTGDPIVAYQKDRGFGAFDCDFVADDIPFSVDDECNGASSTCTVTAL